MAQIEQSLVEEEKRLARNQQLMDAYGDKKSLNDVQQALDTYHAQ
jgi:predicted  nucleic acid-binding Zn-ribbon protein